MKTINYNDKSSQSTSSLQVIQTIIYATYAAIVSINSTYSLATVLCLSTQYACRQVIFFSQTSVLEKKDHGYYSLSH